MKSKAVRAEDWLRFARQFMEKLPARSDRQPGNSPGEDAALETQVLLAHVLEKPRAWVLAHPETVLTPRQQRLLTRLLGDLAMGTPLPYLTGQQEFFGLAFEVSPAVLIPRPETELLVERALEWLGRYPERRRAADVGTGSGCIAVSLAHHVPDLRILAVDRSWDALRVARRNAALHQVAQRITFIQDDLLSAAAGPFDLVCANLPYIPSHNLSTLPVAAFEPHLALDGGPDGLLFVSPLLADAPRWLAPGGRLLLEIQFDQGEAVTALAQAHLPGAQIAVCADLAGLPRLVEIKNHADHPAPIE
jgi:release factor glutamine methyltransferase